MNIYKLIFRGLIFPFIVKLRIEKLFLNKDNFILNLMFHGVTDINNNFSIRHMSKSVFIKIIDYLQKNFKIISLEQAYMLLQNNEKLKDKYITISFDDGFKNNYTTVLPILEKRKIYATIFTTTVGVYNEHKILLPEILSALKYFNIIDLKIDGLNFYNQYNSKKKINLHDYINQCTYQKRTEIIEEIITEYNLINKLKLVDDDLWKIMNEEEIKKVDLSNYLSIESHTSTHVKLTSLNKEDIKSELFESKKLLENILGRSINYIAFPYGDYNEEVKEISKNLGYKYLLAVHYMLDNDSKDESILNRHGLSTTTTYESNIIMLNKVTKSKGIIC